MLMAMGRKDFSVVVCITLAVKKPLTEDAVIVQQSHQRDT